MLCCAVQAQQPWSRELHGWTVDELRAYVIWAKATGQNLTMSPAAEQVGARWTGLRLVANPASLTVSAVTVCHCKHGLRA